MAHRLESPELPRNVQTLMLQRQEANSRFLTECYLFPAALRSGLRPKITCRIDFSGSGASWSGLCGLPQSIGTCVKKSCYDNWLTRSDTRKRARALARHGIAGPD